MLSDAAKKRGCSFGEIAARYLIEISGTDLSTLQNELNKLCAFVGSGEITKETVENGEEPKIYINSKKTTKKTPKMVVENVETA